MSGVFSLMMGSFFTILLLYLYRKQAKIQRVGKNSKTHSHRPTKSKDNHPYRCVEIEPCLGACQKVIPYKNIKILVDKAPKLPLRGCDHKKCECKFIRYSDRRVSERRDKGGAREMIAQMQENSGQRAWPDRRRGSRA